MGGAGNGAAEEDWRWDLNPGAAAIWRVFLGPGSLFETMNPFGDHAALEVLPFCHVDGAGSLNHGLLLLS